MYSSFVQSNWALLLAAAIFTLVILVIASGRILRSGHGQLRRFLAELAEQRTLLSRASATTQKAENKVDNLLQKSATVKPRIIQEARGAMQDARLLEKIASDKVLIAENHVRRIIFEEFPPNRQARLRDKYLPDDMPVDKPFSF
jgi:hypothetical protein